ncbi:hypothetical protein [Parvibaculum sp.]|uniref:hypothetical protein n=1 Tax=Parvibaculum sp. TaxID=2024848 RepID=UPI002FD9513E
MPALPTSAAAFLIASCLAGLFGAGPARADTGTGGIAFVQAPEQSSGVCAAGNPDKGFACAREKCTEGGAAAGDCLRVAWCYPAGWSVDVFMQHREGPHWHDYSCGWASREAALQAAKVKCDPAFAEALIECTAVMLWTPEGVEQPIE